MANREPAETAERALRVFLRLIAVTTFVAVVFVVAPYSWMNAIHSWLGMGDLPDEPIVGYLSRSSSQDASPLCHSDSSSSGVSQRPG